MEPMAYFVGMLADAGEDSDEAKAQLSDGLMAVILEDTVLTGKARMYEDALYLDYELARRTLNSRFFWDEDNRLLLYTTALETYEIPENSADYTIDGEKKTYERPVILADEKGLYLSADFLQEYTNVEYVIRQEEYHVLIHNRWEIVLQHRQRRRARSVFREASSRRS